jgi:Flp pilus assembly protein TadD
VQAAFLSAAKTHQKAGNHEKAIKYTQKAAEMNPENPQIYSSRGKAYLEEGKIEAGALDYQKTVELDKIWFPILRSRIAKNLPKAATDP